MGKKKWKPIIQMVREFLPAPGTMVGEFTFLSPDALWGGTLDNGLSFVAVAEDRWPDGGMFLMVDVFMLAIWMGIVWSIIVLRVSLNLR